jgi:SAM-dependent methyltransferase
VSILSNLGWAALYLRPSEIKGKKILEVGSRNWDVTLTDYIKDAKPMTYMGTDMMEGRNVDLVCPAEKLVEHFGKEKFDVVVCCEVLEHVENWPLAIQNMKDVLAPGGIILLTTRTKGYPEHGFPNDYWRFESQDLFAIFTDFIVDAVYQDDQHHGSYIKAVKPVAGTERALPDNITIYSMKKGARISYGS